LGAYSRKSGKKQDNVGLKDLYGEDEAECNTKKDNSESVLRTAGNMYAVSNCGIIYLVRELYR